jgi:rubrerythrin
MIEDLNLHKAVEFAIKTEEQGAAFYDRLAAKFADNEELKEVFTVLARDEEIHQIQFRRLLKELPEGERCELSDADQEYLRALSAAEIFYGNNDALNKVDDMETAQDGLERALGLERSTLLYYTAMREVLGSSEVLDAIIQTEKEHMVRVMKYMVTGAKMRGLLEDY